MNYKMEISIANPTNTSESRVLELECEFGYDPNQYGNGHSVRIRGKGGMEWCYDLRYDTSFCKNEKEAWLINWAKTNWSGENGSWKITELMIKEKL